MSHVERICVTGEGDKPMERVGEVEAVAGGLAGDRYPPVREDDGVAVVGGLAKRSWSL